MASPWICEDGAPSGDAWGVVPPAFHGIEVQARSSHWGSVEERRSYVHREVERLVADPDAAFVVEEAMERAARQQRVTDHQRTCDTLERRDRFAIESELAKDKIRRLGGAEINAYPLLQMHSAMAGVLEPYFPFIELVASLTPGLAELIALYELLEGERPLTREPVGEYEAVVGVVLAAAPMATSVIAAGPEAVLAVANAIARRTGTSARGAAELVRGLSRIEPSEARLLLRAGNGEKLTAAERAIGRRALRDLRVDQRALARGAAFDDKDIFAHYAEESRTVPSTTEDPVHDRLRVTNAQGAGASKNPHHHVFPQQESMQDWFAQHDIDIHDYTRQLEQAHHEAIHGGANRKLAKQWPGEWNNAIWRQLQKAESKMLRSEGRRLTKIEIETVGKEMMQEYRIDGPLERYPRAPARSEP